MNPWMNESEMKWIWKWSEQRTEFLLMWSGTSLKTKVHSLFPNVEIRRKAMQRLFFHNLALHSVLSSEPSLSFVFYMSLICQNIKGILISQFMTLLSYFCLNDDIFQRHYISIRVNLTQLHSVVKEHSTLPQIAKQRNTGIIVIV